MTLVQSERHLSPHCNRVTRHGQWYQSDNWAVLGPSFFVLEFVVKSWQFLWTFCYTVLNLSWTWVRREPMWEVLFKGTLSNGTTIILPTETEGSCKFNQIRVYPLNFRLLRIPNVASHCFMLERMEAQLKSIVVIQMGDGKWPELREMVFLLLVCYVILGYPLNPMPRAWLENQVRPAPPVVFQLIRESSSSSSSHSSILLSYSVTWYVLLHSN